MKLTHKVLGQTVTSHGGTVAQDLEDADVVVYGARVGEAQQNTSDDKALVTMSEDTFKSWVESGDEPGMSSD